MKTPRFEAYKINQLIRTRGDTYIFRRDLKNEFKEPTGEQVTITLRGVWHTEREWVELTRGDGASVGRKPFSFLLTSYDAGRLIQQGDFILVDGKRYNVNAVDNLNQLNYAIDISLEAVV